MCIGIIAIAMLCSQKLNNKPKISLEKKINYDKVYRPQGQRCESSGRKLQLKLKSCSQ